MLTFVSMSIVWMAVFPTAMAVLASVTSLAMPARGHVGGTVPKRTFSQSELGCDGCVIERAGVMMW